jgi:succinate dehydrogenase / fumarate reductase cytochrome b subunit
MATDTSATTRERLAGRRAFLMRKLHSLTGVVPVGGFMVFHLWTNARALKGQESFDEAVRGIHDLPYLPVLEIGLILLPLAFHALYGVKLALEARTNVSRYPYNRNWMFVAQRVTGLVALVFIVWHLQALWLQKWLGKLAAEAFYPALCESLSSTNMGLPLNALAYLFGIAACVFHFTNGLWGFCFSWGLTVSRRAQRISATVFGLAGVVLFFLGANTAIYFATGARIAVFGVPSSSQTAQTTKTCPDVVSAPAPALPATQLPNP